MMRCRRLSHPYTLLIKRNHFQLIAEEWREEKIKTIAQSRWRPPTDIYETDSAIYINVELAGMGADKIDIAIYENALVIEGWRQLQIDGEAGVYYSSEIRQGPFRLEIVLPESVNRDSVRANYDQGLLCVVLQKY